MHALTMEARYGYATAGDVQIAYADLGGSGPDLVVVPGMASHLDLFLSPPASHIFERLAAFSRVIIYDKRGTGLSDPVTDVPTLDVRMEEISAVMEAAGSERAIVFGISEGSAMALLFAATHPERVSSLVLYGALAKSTWAPDYPWANRAEDMAQAGAELILPYWGQGIWAESTSPSEADNPKVREWYARFERMAASPAMLTKLFAMFMDIDVRRIVSSVHVPTLLLHRRGDRLVNVRNAHWLAEHMPDATYIELEGIDHSLARLREPGSDRRRDRTIRDRFIAERRAGSRPGDSHVHGHRRIDRARIGARRQEMARGARGTAKDRARGARAVPGSRDQDDG
jgi:pimeloyl-ACP methyl ester carboxylesterase